MKRIMLLSLVLVLGGVAVAWAGKEAYTLVMNKEKEVCTAILKLFNEDTERYGELQYEKHKEFIVWEPIKTGAAPQDATYDSPSLKQTFDINNDGTNELVLRERHYLRGQLIDSLFIYPAETKMSEVLENPNLEPIGIVDFAGYYLRQGSTAKPDKPPTAIGVVRIEAFRSGRNTYISLADWNQSWIVIARFLRGRELEDVCYFHGKSRLAR